MIDLEYLRELVPDQEREDMEDLHDHDAMRLLKDLGYLGGEIHVPPRLVSPDVREQAIAAFRKELQLMQKVDQEGYKSLLEDLDWSLEPGTESDILSDEELQVLRELMAFDGDFRPGVLPDAADNQLSRRVLQYRLALLGLVGTDAEGLADMEVLKEGLELIRELLNLDSLIETYRITGDLDSLLHAILASGGGFYGLALSPRDHDRAKSRKLRGKSGRAFAKQLRLDLGAGDYAKFESGIWDPLKAKDREAESLVRKSASTVQNEILVRVVYLQLWADGFLDASPLRASDREVDDALDRLLRFQFNSRSQRNACEDRLYVTLVDNLMAFNLHLFWTLVIPADVASAERQTLDEFDQLYDEPEKAPNQTGGQEQPFFVRKMLESNLKKLPDQLREKWSSSIPTYSGRRFGRVFAKIKEKVKSFFQALKRFLAWVKNGLQGFFNTIKKGLRFFATSIEYIQNGPGLVTTLGGVTIQSASECPGTMVHLVPVDATPDLMQLHLERMKNRRQDFERACYIVGKVLNWTIKIVTGAVSWVRLGIRVARLLLDFLRGRSAPVPELNPVS